jgi:hypothetical protein
MKARELRELEERVAAVEGYFCSLTMMTGEAFAELRDRLEALESTERHRSTTADLGDADDLPPIGGS